MSTSSEKYFLEKVGMQKLYGKIKSKFYESPDIDVSGTTLIIKDTVDASNGTSSN